MRGALVVAAKDLRLRARDRSLYLIGIVAPFVLASIVGLALGSTTEFSATLAFADEDGTGITAPLTAMLESQDLARVVTVRTENDEAAVREAVRNGDADVGLVVPTGFGEGVSAGEQADLLVIEDPDGRISGAFATGIAEGFVANIRAGQVAVGAVSVLEGGAVADPAALASEAARRFPQIDLRAAGRTAELRPIDYFAPAMGILFLFFTVLYGAASIQAERRNRTLARLAVAPVSPNAIVAGKLLALLLTGLLVFSVVIVSTSLVYDVAWGDPVAVAILAFTTVLSAIGLTGLIAVVARTEEQVRGVGTAIVFVLAVAGGSFIGAQLPEFFRQMQQATPNGRALVGFTELILAEGGGSLATVAPAVAFTASVGVIGIGFTFLLGRRAIRS